MLADIASVATLVLFFIYFVGRIITIFSVKNICCDEIIYEERNFDRAKYRIVDTANLEENGENAVILTSVQGIRNICIYELELDDELNCTSENKIFTHKFLNVGQSLEIVMSIPELIAKYRIEFETPDFQTASLTLTDNLKSGVESEMTVLKHTWRSVLYYLFR